MSTIIELTKSFLEKFFEKILNITDYYVQDKHITLSEAFLLLITTGRALWFTIFGVNIMPVPQNGLLINEAWTPVFWVLIIAHFASFFLERPLIRTITVAAYAFVWCFLAILVALTQISSPAFPTFILFALLAVIIAARLLQDDHMGRESAGISHA